MANAPQPNVANMNAAITDMAADGAAIAQGAQSFANHQQAFSNEIILAAVAQMQQQLAQILQQLGQIQQQLTAIQADTRELRELTSARYINPLFPSYNSKIMCFLYRDFNNHVRFTHTQIFRATDSLITMRSVDTTANALVQLNAPIPNLPPTADAVTQLTGTVYT